MKMPSSGIWEKKQCRSQDMRESTHRPGCSGRLIATMGSRGTLINVAERPWMRNMSSFVKIKNGPPIGSAMGLESSIRRYGALLGLRNVPGRMEDNSVSLMPNCAVC